MKSEKIPLESRPTAALYSSQEIASNCAANLASLTTKIEQFATQPLPAPSDTRRVLSQWDAIYIAYQDAEMSTSVLSSLSPDSAVRSASEKCSLKMSALANGLVQDPRNYAQFKDLVATDAIDQKFLDDTIKDFEAGGIHLPEEKRKKLKAIRDENNQFSQEFERHIRENPVTMTFTPAQMQGLPEGYRTALKRDASGNYLLNMDFTTYRTFMQLADDDDARKQYFLTYSRRGTPANLVLINKIIANRLALATLLGYASYADYALSQNRMAKDPATVNAFLSQIHAVVAEREKKEIAALREFRAASEHRPLADVTIRPWNLAYWSTRQKKSLFNLDQEAQRAYFPPQAAIDWLLAISSRLYGVEFRRVEVPVWHPDVRYYDVIDNRTQQRIAGIYLDLFPREGKYKHAAAANIRGASTLTGRTPISVLMTNFNPQGLTQPELVTFAHEFGHGLHGVLSQTRYASQSGTAVERDFVEAPSQMFEEWARRLPTLSMVADYCKPACPRVDAAMVKTIKDSRKLSQGSDYAAQTAFAMFDMSVHTAQPPDAMTSWIAISSKTALGYVPGTEFPGNFGHIASGYAAGYYGYMWSEVLAMDMLSPFKPDMLSSQVGAHYRSTILSRGGERPATAMLKDFLGREPDNQAFFDTINGRSPLK